jgi:hypothetical protein
MGDPSRRQAIERFDARKAGIVNRRSRQAEHKKSPREAGAILEGLALRAGGKNRAPPA